MIILIVEDYYVDSFMLEKVLEEDGINKQNIYIVDDGNKAIKEITNKKPNIIFLDITIPYLNGVEILRYINERMINYNPLVFIITNNDNIEIINETKKLGASAYAIKALSLKDLKKIICVIKYVFIEQKFEYIHFDKI